MAEVGGCGRVELFGRRSLLGGGSTKKAVVGIWDGLSGSWAILTAARRRSCSDDGDDGDDDSGGFGVMIRYGGGVCVLRGGVERGRERGEVWVGGWLCVSVCPCLPSA